MLSVGLKYQGKITNTSDNQDDTEDEMENNTKMNYYKAEIS